MDRAREHLLAYWEWAGKRKIPIPARLQKSAWDAFYQFASTIPAVVLLWLPVALFSAAPAALACWGRWDLFWRTWTAVFAGIATIVLLLQARWGTPQGLGLESHEA